MSTQPQKPDACADEILSSLTDTYGQGVQLRALHALRDASAASRVVQTVFSEAASESRRAQGGFPAGAFIAYATEKAIMEERFGANLTPPAPAEEEVIAVPPAKAAATVSPAEAKRPAEAAHATRAPAQPSRIAPAPAESAPSRADTETLQNRPAPRTRPAYVSAPDLPRREAVSPEETLRRARARLAETAASHPENARPAPPALSAQPPHPAERPERKTREQPKKGPGNGLLIGLVILFTIVLFWLMAGILMDLDVLPAADLGYRYFNERLFPLFQSF